MRKIIGTFLLFAISLSVFSQIKVQKSDVVKVINHKKYYIHIVKKGETVYSISNAYDVSIKDIKLSNSMYNNDLVIGEQILIPYINISHRNDNDYISHKVKQGETLYSISKKYNVSINDLKHHNADLENGLKKGQVIRIPNLKKGNFEFQDDNFFYHTVESGHTLFSIAQRYGTTVDQIKFFNPETKNGLKVGQSLKIPKSNYDNTERLPVVHDSFLDMDFYKFDANYFEEPGVTPCKSFNYTSGKTFKIALMLPLFVEENKWVISRYRNEGDAFVYKNSSRFIEFYQGVLVALEKLKAQGISFDISVFDTEGSQSVVRDIIQKNNPKDFDLIIGPIYSKNIKIVSHYAKKNKVNLISPMSVNNEVLEDNPFVFQAIPSIEMRVKRASQALSRLYDTSLVFIHNGTKEEKDLIELYKRKLVKSFSTNPDVREIVIKNIDYNFGEVESVETALSVSTENLIILPSDDQVFVTKVIENIQKLAKDYKILVLGSPTWELYQNININHLRDLNFQYISPVFIDYNNWRTSNFIKHYRKSFDTEPGFSAFEGFDIMMYFGQALKQYGKHFQFCLNPEDKSVNNKGTVFEFIFDRTGKYNGFENNGTFLLKYNSKFQLEKFD